MSSEFSISIWASHPCAVVHSNLYESISCWFGFVVTVKFQDCVDVPSMLDSHSDSVITDDDIPDIIIVVIVYKFHLLYYVQQY